MKLTLPTDSNVRKEVPMWRGLLRYFPAALAGVARISFLGNQKHNPGQEMHHARSKSNDHGDCVVRHLTDVGDYLAELEREQDPARREQLVAAMLIEVDQQTWRQCAFSQDLHERFGGAPLAPAAKP